MSVRQDLITALDGGTPEITPLSIYSFFLNVSDDCRPFLRDQGLGITEHVGTCAHHEHGVENEQEDRHEGGTHYRIYRKKTPVGTVQKVTRNGWHHEDWVKSPADYKVFQWIAEHTELTPAYDRFHEVEAQLGEQGLTIASGSRTPAMVINVDIAGTERFCMDVAMEVPELFALYEAMKVNFIAETKIIAGGPGRFVKWLENLTIGMIGPRRYGELLMSVYNECVPLLVAADKRVMVHYDGQLRVIADQIASAPFHMIESLTEPPEGDMTYDACRAIWPDKVFWGNINVDIYARPEAELRAEVAAKRERAGKRALAFEVSEDMPRNWRESIPIVLDTLRQLG